MHRLLLALTALFAVFGTARAEPFVWSYVAESKSLIGMVQEEEGDFAFHAACTSPAAVRLGIGAQPGIGNGEGHRVSVVLETSTRKLRIEGTSGHSANFEMTAGVELQVTVPVTHPVFQLLADPGPIVVSGDLKAFWPAPGRTAALKAFLAACR